MVGKETIFSGRGSVLVGPFTYNLFIVGAYNNYYYQYKQGNLPNDYLTRRCNLT